MNQRVLLFAAIVLLFAAPARSEPLLEEIYKVTEEGGAIDWRVSQVVSISAPYQTFNPKRWIVERARKDTRACQMHAPRGGCRSVVRSHDWIDSEVCPALLVALRELGEIQMPPFAGAREIGFFITDHTPYLTIEGRPKSLSPTARPHHPRPMPAHIKVTEQVGPFRDWWDETGVFEALLAAGSAGHRRGTSQGSTNIAVLTLAQAPSRATFPVIGPSVRVSFTMASLFFISLE